MSTILIIDDEEDLLVLLQQTLKKRGYNVLTARDGFEGVSKAQLLPDLILLDIMLPGMDGFRVLSAIRDQVTCPILFLSAKQAEADRIMGLNLGGDDYLVKPFNLGELVARIEANLRREARSQAHEPGEQPRRRGRLFFGDLSLDIKARQVLFNEQTLSLTRREFDIVELLALHPGQVFSKEQIYARVWGYDAEGDSGTVTEHVKNIRAKLAEAGAAFDFIATVWGIGYRWQKGLPV